MRKYLVQFYRESVETYTVDADSAEEAQALAEELNDLNGYCETLEDSQHRERLRKRVDCDDSEECLGISRITVEEWETAP